MDMNSSSAQLDSLFDPDLVASQQPNWPGGKDGAQMAKAVAELRALPPLVFAGECDDLKAKIAEAAAGRAFWLQGGDCAETFTSATADSIRNRIKTILQMAAVLQYYSSLPVIKVGRMAGQFAKPRSNDLETRGDVTLPAYRGDAVNDIEFTKAARTPDPNRLVRVYNTSAATLNLVRAFTRGGFADLRQVHEWNKGFIRDSQFGEKYEQMATEIGRALSFMASAGVDPEQFKAVDFYASHEALIIEYEKALTRIDSRTELAYDVSGHFVWIGERTRQLDGAHVDFASKVRNPIGIKLGPKSTVEDALEWEPELFARRCLPSLKALLRAELRSCGYAILCMAIPSNPKMAIRLVTSRMSSMKYAASLKSIRSLARIQVESILSSQATMSPSA
jgi:3-deoxy-7-phosphoheptulonate synthase